MDFFITFLFGLAVGVAGHALISAQVAKAVADVKAEIAKLEAAIKAKV